MQSRLDRRFDAMTIRRRTVEHVFGTLKHWMESTHFQTRGIGYIAAEMSLHVLAYNLKRVIRILGFAKADARNEAGRRVNSRADRPTDGARLAAQLRWAETQADDALRAFTRPRPRTAIYLHRRAVVWRSP
jgi:hypothetical protein